MASTTSSKKRFIDIHVSGCVRKHPKLPHKLLLGSTVRDAIKKAGGFRKEPYPPSGIISIRSKRLRDGKYYCRRRFNYKRWPKLLSLTLYGGRHGSCAVRCFNRRESGHSYWIIYLMEVARLPCWDYIKQLMRFDPTLAAQEAKATLRTSKRSLGRNPLN